MSTSKLKQSIHDHVKMSLIYVKLTKAWNVGQGHQVTSLLEEYAKDN